MSFDYLNEAFKKLELLKEDTFDTSPNGLARMKSFMDADLEDNSVRVIDPEADRDEDLQDSYIGKVITNCNVCHSNIFEDKEDIVIDEDGTVNADKQCPYCGETMGFTVMGEVTEFVAPADKDADPKVTVDGEEVPVEGAQAALEESVSRDERSLNKTSLTEGMYDAEIEVWAREMVHTKQPKDYFSKREFDDYIWDCIDITSRQDQIQPRVEKICQTKGLREFFLEVKNADILEDTKNPDYKKALECANIIAWCILDVLGPNKHVTQHVAQKGITKDSEWSVRDVFSSAAANAEQTKKATDDLIARYNKNESFLSESADDGKSLKPHTLKILKMLDEEPLEEELLTESGFDDRPLESWLSAMYQRDIPKKYHSLPKSTFKNSEWDFEDHLHDAIFDSSASRDMIGNRANRIVSHYKLDEFVNDLDNIKILDNPKDPEYNTALQVVDILAWCIVDAFGRSGTQVKHTHSQSTDGNKNYYSSREDTYSSAGDLIANYKKYRSSIKESVNNVNVETDDSIVNIKSDEGGKVTVSTEPKEPETTGEEAIGPVSDETIADIEAANAPEEEPVEDAEPAAEEEPSENAEPDAEEESNEDEYEDVDFEEVDEESFDELGESYLKRVYENVDSFRTCDVSSEDNKLIVEGIIKFKSGAEKKTGFVFEAHSASDGKVRFTGMNEHFSRGSKSFALTGKVENKKLISESLTYNYRAKVGNGKSTRIYGTISK